MTLIPLSVQLYSVREDAAKNFPAVLKAIAGFGYVGVEFAGFHGHTARELRTILDDLGLVTSSAHGALPTAANRNQIIDEARALGYTRHVAGFGPEHFSTREKTLEAAARSQQAAAVLQGTGISFGIHNHWWEFDHRLDGQSPHALFMQAAPAVFAQIDTYWVTVAGGDAAQVVRDYAGRAPLLHIKDGPANREAAMTAVGQGTLDWPRIIGAAADTTEWLIVELDRCDTPMLAALAASQRYLVTQGLARGRG